MLMKGIFMKCFTTPESVYGGHANTECGMRNPSSRRQIDDDLSRLTTSSESSRDQCVATVGTYALPETDNNSNEFSSNYLPQVIDPIEWQQKCSRKRKERQDSTSSITQDRKLVRSNSEEYLPNVDYNEVLRRVSSHEDIPNPLNENIDDDDGLLSSSSASDELGTGSGTRHRSRIDANNCYRIADDRCSVKSTNYEVQEILREAHRRVETSPARSRTFDFSYKMRISPNRDAIVYARREDPDAESEHRRGERFCKTRGMQTPRKGTGASTSNASMAPIPVECEPVLCERNDNVYKYDLNAMKEERRGFASKSRLQKEIAVNSPRRYTEDGGDDCGDDVEDDDYDYDDDVSSSWSDHNDNNNIDDASNTSSTSQTTKQKHESLPWDDGDDVVPVVSERFAEGNVQVSSVNVMKVHNASATKSPSAAHYAKSENLKTREIMKSTPLPSAFATPDEKLKQINKRLTALKKRVVTFEDAFEEENGFRPSHSIKQSDRYVKNVLADIHKLRKEKQALKTDPMAAMGYKTLQSGGDSKVHKMRTTIAEVEQRLQEKRDQENRSDVLDDLTADQLVQEKSAVQRALLYLESLYGRPNTRDERDVARSLYDRYRIIKRMVNRSVSISGTGVNNLSELPTILEHEAMAFTVATVALTPPPSDSENSFVPSTSFDSPFEQSLVASSNDSPDTSSSINENVQHMSLEELSRNLDIVRDEKKQLRRTIKEFEEVFEVQNGRKMLKSDRSMIEETYAMYKQKKAKLRLLDALIRKQMNK